MGQFSKKNQWSLMLLCVILMVITGIALLSKLEKDLKRHQSAKPVSRANTTSMDIITSVDGISDMRVSGQRSEMNSCEKWLKNEDAIVYSRDFQTNPIRIAGLVDKGWENCAVGCKFEHISGKIPDATFGSPRQAGITRVLRSMESSQYYTTNNITLAKQEGYNILMTSSLSSDVPVGYFSWAEYDFMAPVQPKTEKAMAAAFISHCGGNNFRLEAVKSLEKSNIQIDSYGACHRNRDGRVDKLETLKHYRFSLAFENSNEEDYVTEKFFQSLVVGSIPVVIGAPNIQDYAPHPLSLLHIKDIEDVALVAKSMKYLAENSDAYSQLLRWKYDGPTDSFKALVDMAAVHSSCRLCIHLATMIREREEKRAKKRPCKCTRGSETIHHLYVRERGRFEMKSIFLRSEDITIQDLESGVLKKFESIKHVPIWKNNRPEILRGGNELKVYKIYPVSLTQRRALYTFKFDNDAHLRNHIEINPCSQFEVIFV